MSRAPTLSAAAPMPTSAERRRVHEITEELVDSLTTQQREEMRRRTREGWSLKFVRQRSNAPAQLVLASPRGTRHVLVDGDGALRPFYNARSCDFS